MRYLILLTLAGCGGSAFAFDKTDGTDPSEAAQEEAGHDEAATLEAAALEAALPEAGTPEAAPPEAGTPDAAEKPEASTPEAAPPDAPPDAPPGPPDAGNPTAACTEPDACRNVTCSTGTQFCIASSSQNTGMCGTYPPECDRCSLHTCACLAVYDPNYKNYSQCDGDGTNPFLIAWGP